jgi:hypothetical protein
MRWVSKALLSLSVLIAGPSLSLADCLKETSLYGLVGSRATVHRSFTLTRPGAFLEVWADGAADKLYMRVKRPSGAAACKIKGPARELSCGPTITRKSGEGQYTIYITNKLSRRVEYTVRCSNPP